MRPHEISIGIVSDIVLRTDEETEYAFSHAKKIADKVDAEKYLNMPRPYPITFGQKMYGYGRGSLEIVQFSRFMTNTAF